MKEKLEKAVENLFEKREPLRLPIQFFSGNGEGDSGNGEGQGDGQGDTNYTGESNTPPAGDNKDNKGSNDDKGNTDTKTFTQEDVNAIATKEARKAQEKLLKQLGVKDMKSAKEGLAQFKRMQEEQMSDAEKAQKRAKELEATTQEQQETIETLNAKVAALSHDVDPDSLEEVIILAKAQVNEDTDINEAVKKIVEKFPSFKKQVEETNSGTDEAKKKPKFTTGEHNGGNKDSTEDLWKQAFKF